jgi:hypothetical protein
MNLRGRREAILAICMVSMFFACAGTKVAQWTSPRDLTYEQVFNASLRATVENKFTIIHSDRAAGLFSSKRQEYRGGSMIERYMSVQLKQVGDKILVSTKTYGSDFGTIPGGGAANKEVTKNFFLCLFGQLNITDSSLRNVVIEDDK